MNSVQKDLQFACKVAIAENIKSQGKKVTKTVMESLDKMTYEQLLNLTFNPNRSKMLIESSVIESNVKKVVMEGPVDWIKTGKDWYTGQDILDKYKKNVDHTTSRYQNDPRDVDFYRAMIRKHQIDAIVDATKRRVQVKVAVYGTVALAALAIFIYRRYLSQAAKSCKGKSGSERTECIDNYKVQGARAAIQQLESKRSKCTSQKNPEKCNMRINKEVTKWKARMKKYS